MLYLCTAYCMFVSIVIYIDIVGTLKRYMCRKCPLHVFLLGHTVRLLGQKKKNGRKIGGADLSLPKIRKNPLIEIIAINTGYVVLSLK